MGNDAGFMIMPGSIPLDVPNVRDELTRHLSEGWNALVDRRLTAENQFPIKQIRLIFVTGEDWLLDGSRDCYAWICPNG